MQKPKTSMVEIVRDEQVLYRFDLAIAEDGIFTVPYNDSYNTVEISGGKIRVKEADCRDHTCVNTGWLDSAAPVVCLPNHLVIRFSDNNNNKIDAVAG